METPGKPVMTFGKKEHLVSRKTIEELFSGGNHSMVAYPVRMVYKAAGSSEAPVQVLVSVSKRHFKHAVKRNRVKRQLREAYRKHKAALTDVVATTGTNHYSIAFVYLADELFPSSVIEEKMARLLTRMAERLSHKHSEVDKERKADEEHHQ